VSGWFRVSLRYPWSESDTKKNWVRLAHKSLISVMVMLFYLVTTYDEWKFIAVLDASRKFGM